VKEFESIIKNIKGLNFVCIKCGLDEETPRPPLNIVKVNEFR